MDMWMDIYAQHVSISIVCYHVPVVVVTLKLEHVAFRQP